jgi:hypothetical protein
LEGECFYERIFPRVERPVRPDRPVLLIEDRDFDSVRLLFATAEERE